MLIDAHVRVQYQQRGACVCAVKANIGPAVNAARGKAHATLDHT